MLVRLAREFVARPPVRGRRYVVRGYPGKGDGRGLPKDAVLGDEDDEATQGGGFEERLGVRRGGGGAWEIGHLPTAGAYSLDSFRMFARDILRGKAEGYDGEGAETIPRAETMTTTVAGIRGGRVDVETPAFEPEWKRVIPLDKELRAWLRWRWLKEGRVYDVRTGRTWEAGEDLVRRGREGGLRWGEIDEVAVGLAAAETAAAEDSGSCGAAGGEGTEGTKGDGEG